MFVANGSHQEQFAGAGGSSLQLNPLDQRPADPAPAGMRRDQQLGQFGGRFVLEEAVVEAQTGDCDNFTGNFGDKRQFIARRAGEVAADVRDAGAGIVVRDE